MSVAALAADCGPGTCDDDNPCTDDTCDAGSGLCIFTDNSRACDDGNPCTENDACDGGTCQPGTATVCNDNNICTTDTCNQATGCVFTNNIVPCNDGNACTTGDVCGGGTCQPGTATVCNDNNVCTTDTCDPSTGCVFTNTIGPCNDGNACTTGDVCGGGTCHPGSAVVCNDNNICTTDACNTTNGCVFSNNLNPCNDGNACTTGDTCAGGSCQPGTAVVCNDNDVCTTDTCNTATGCVFTNNTHSCDDGNACTVNDRCNGGTCRPGTAVVCNDNNVCTTDTCNPATGCVFTNNTNPCDDGNVCATGDTCAGGTCQPGTPLVCNDNNVCTTDTCNPATGCVFTNNTSACDDGNACTQTDTCQSGTCTGSNPVVCTASDQCHVAGTCNPANGTCSNPNATNGTGCNDSNACTQSDSCQNGTCTGSNPVVCTASDPCHVAGTCNPANGTCSNPNAANGTTCNDGNSCTQTDTCQSGTCTGSNPVVCTASDQCHVAGTCNPANGTCSNPNATNGTTCNDANACTQTDTCQTGTCTGANPVVCTALDQCHNVGTCNTGTGVCSNPNKSNGTACNDGNACTQTDTCQTGTCTGANPVVCTALDQCHNVGTCNTGTGVCSNPNKSNGTACNDGNACTQTDTCQTGTCTGANPVVCTALDQCHNVGTCDTGTGVCSNPNKTNGTVCNDGNACTQSDTCQTGTCTGANPVVCTALDQCHSVGTCNTGTGVCSNPNTTNGTACNDGNACTQSDTCQTGTCTGANPVVCTALDQCHTVGTCNTGTGACSNPNAANGTSCSDGNACTIGDACSSGTCQPGSGLVCNDSNICTTDSCDVLTGCVFANNTNPCDDANACTSGDTCGGGTCQAGMATVCNDQNQCTDDACSPATGQCVFTNDNTNACSDGSLCTFDICVSGTCVSQSSVNCNDGNPCTDDSCNGRTGHCVHTNDDANPCSDGNACTNDSCSSGNCVGTMAVFCNDGNPCTDDDCDPANGACVYAANDAFTCADDGTGCTTPACSAGACVCTVPLTLWTDATYPGGLDFGVNMGLSWGDYDADGRIDLFNAFSGTLFRNLAGSSWEFAQDLSTLYPPSERRYGSSFGDYDNDGLPDIAIAPRVPAWGDDRFHLLHNLGGGENFTDIASNSSITDVQPYGNAETLSWADVDGDGNLDLFVPVYPGTLGPGSFFLYNLGPTGPEGAYRFAESSGAVGLDVPSDCARPEGAQFADADLDGDVDLFANDTLYQNQSTPNAPSFLPLSQAASGIGLRGSMDEGAMFFDYDLDGDLDLVVAYVNEGVKIWENRGDGTFFATKSSVVDAPMTGLNLGMSAEDWDNDGDIDFTTRDVFRRNMLVEDGTRHFTVEHHAIPGGHVTSALPAWGDWDADGDLDCAMGNWGADGHLYKNTLYTSATPMEDRRYVRVRVVRDAALAPRGLEVEYGAVAEIHLLNVTDAFRRRKFVASSHGYLNQNEYDLQFGLPPHPASGPDLRFDLSVDFPGTAADGLRRIDKHVNPKLGDIDLTSLTDREITVDRSGRIVVNGVAYDPIGDASPRLLTSGGGLALPGAQPLPEPGPSPSVDWYAGLAFETQAGTKPIAVREILLDGQLGAPVDCGSGAFNVVLWDVTTDSPFIVAGGALNATTSDRNRRTAFITDAVLAPGRAYRIVAHVTSYRTSPITTQGVQAGLLVRGGIAYASPSCSTSAMAEASADPASVALAVRFTQLASGSCVGLPAFFCDDGNPCTDDACGPSGSCVHTNNAATCDDGNACTSADHCGSGACSGTAIGCDDGNVCTTDNCDPALGCTHAPNNEPCNDGNLCSLVDACSGGACSGVTFRVCNDGNPCTDDSCNPATGCVFTVDNGNACSDSNVCTSADHCVAGACAGTAISCDDGNTCTTDACIPSFGCTHNPFEVTGVRFTTKTALAWNSSAGGGSLKYDVATGDRARLATLGSGVSESCSANDTSSNTLTVSQTPASGASFWYLVRAFNNTCGQGTYGFSYQKPAPAAERILSTCP